MKFIGSLSGKWSNQIRDELMMKLAGGDIMTLDGDKNTVVDRNSLWPGAQVPYVIAASYSTLFSFSIHHCTLFYTFFRRCHPHFRQPPNSVEFSATQSANFIPKHVFVSFHVRPKRITFTSAETSMSGNSSNVLC